MRPRRRQAGGVQPAYSARAAMSSMRREVVHFPAGRADGAAAAAAHGLPGCYDLIEADLDEVGKRRFRAALVADLDGLVVEIGADAGLMLPHHPRDIRVVATEPDQSALQRAAERTRLARRGSSSVLSLMPVSPMKKMPISNGLNAA